MLVNMIKYSILSQFIFLLGFESLVCVYFDFFLLPDNGNYPSLSDILFPLIRGFVTFFLAWPKSDIKGYTNISVFIRDYKPKIM